MTRSKRPSGPAVILAHGGAGAKALTSAQEECLRLAIVAGYELLRRRGAATEAVEETIRIMESSGLFNAGTGARLQLDGARRMDAAIMEGRHLRAGAVAGIERVRHPVSAARLVMEKTAHVLIVGAHATRLARHFKLDHQAPVTEAQRDTAQRLTATKGKQHGTLMLYRKWVREGGPAGRGPLPRWITREETVGAVALDLYGNLAAGASTGGVPFMLPGRVGDTPLIGCGVYADNEAGAVSMTGIGESIIRLAAAKEIVDRLARGDRPAAAARRALDKLVKRIRTAEEIGVGALVLARDGRFAIRHSSVRMAAGYWTGRGEPIVADRFR